jgi:hypothetical protein
LCRALFHVSKVAEADAHKPVALLRAKVHVFAQLQGDLYQSFAGREEALGVWLRVGIQNSLVVSFSTTVRAVRPKQRLRLSCLYCMR